MKTKRDEIQDEAASLIEKERDSILFISIRLGKTRIALKAIKAEESVLVVYPNTAIKKSWTDETEKYEPLSKNITYVLKTSLEKVKDKSYDYVIIDEPQLLSANQLSILKTISFKRRVGLTGTMKKTTINRLRETLGMEVKYTYGIAEAIRDKLVKDYEIFVHFVDLDEKLMDVPYMKYGKEVVGTERMAYNAFSETMSYFENSQESTRDARSLMGFKKYMGLRTNFLYNSKTLFEFTKKIVDQFKDEKVLIYALRQDIADRLSNVSFHSGNKDVDVLEDFKEAKKGHLSVVNCVQAGVTIKNLNKVIFHTCESNTEIFYQKLGRSLLYEYEGEKSQIHICALKDTQMETWVNNACKSLEQDKIKYVYNGKTYNKLEWIKFSYPGRQLYSYNGSICIMLDDEQQQFSKYVFVENIHSSYAKEYTLSKDRVVKI